MGKSAALLRAVAEHPDGLSLAALSRATAIPRPTARRLVDALAAERLLVRLRDQDTILLGPGLLDLSRAVPQTRLLVEAARVPLGQLVARVAESASLVVEQSDGTLTGVLHVDAPRRLRPASWVGQVWRPLPSATGRVLLAALSESDLAARMDAGGLGVELLPDDRARLQRDLDEVRAAGFGYGANELEDGLAVVAVPVERLGILRAIATVSAPTTRLGSDDAPFVAGELRRVAAQIAAAG